MGGKIDKLPVTIGALILLPFSLLLLCFTKSHMSDQIALRLTADCADWFVVDRLLVLLQHLSLPE